MIGSSGCAGAVGHVTGHRVVKHKNPIGHKASKPAKTVVTVGKLKPVPAKPPTVPAPTVPVAPPPVPYISLPGAVTSLTSSTDSSACVDTGTLCTAEQLCEIWGMNCPSVPPVPSRVRPRRASPRPVRILLPAGSRARARADQRGSVEPVGRPGGCSCRGAGHRPAAALRPPDPRLRGLIATLGLEAGREPTSRSCAGPTGYAARVATQTAWAGSRPVRSTNAGSAGTSSVSRRERSSTTRTWRSPAGCSRCS